MCTHRLAIIYSEYVLTINGIVAFLGGINMVLVHFCDFKTSLSYDWLGDVIKLTHFPRYWPFVRGIHRSPVNSPNATSDAEL